MNACFRSMPRCLRIFLLGSLFVLIIHTDYLGAFPLTVSQDSGPTEATQEASDVSDATVITNEGINFLSLLTRGGWFMVPLLVLSLLVVAIGLERAISLRRGKVFPHRFIRQLSNLSRSPGGLEPRAAYEICQRFPSAAADVLKAALVKVGRPQLELEHAVAEASQRQATRMAHLVSWLGLAAAIAPLIGLLGTVWGITQAFYDTTQLVAGQNRAEALAEGIYTALVTTLFGLVIAIPAAILAHYFENRIVSLMNDIEEMVFNLMPQLERYEGKIRFSEVRPTTATNDPSTLPDGLQQTAEAGHHAADSVAASQPASRVPR